MDEFKVGVLQFKVHQHILYLFEVPAAQLIEVNISFVLLNSELFVFVLGCSISFAGFSNEDTKLDIPVQTTMSVPSACLHPLKLACGFCVLQRTTEVKL